MSLLDKINENTEKVRTGKSNLVAAITSKGGSVSAAGSVPTFNELINGVNSIDTSSGGGGGGSGGEPIIETITVYSAGNGAVDMTATAVTDISANDSIKVVKNTTGEVSYVGKNIVPYTASIMTEDSEGHVSSVEYTLSYNYCSQAPWFMGSTYHSSSDPHGFYNSPSNKFICVGARSPVSYYFPFFLVDGRYKQVKIDGAYNRFSNYIAYNYYKSVVAYDEDKKLLYLVSNGNTVYVYKFDEAMLNLTLLTSVRMTCRNLAYACNGHIIYSDSYHVYINKFDESTNSFIGSTRLYQGQTYSYAAHKIIRLPDDGLIILIGQIGGADNPKACKLIYDRANETYSLYTTITNGIGAGECNWADMPDEQTLFIMRKADVATFHIYTLTMSSSKYYQSTEDTNLSNYFLDDTSVFDTSNISGFIIDRSGYMLAIMSSGDWILLYTEYDENNHMLGYKVVANLKTDFTPTPANYFMGYTPNINFAHGYFLNDAEPFTGAENVYLYKKEIAGGEYLIQKTNNQLYDGNNLYGYGVAKSDILAGEEGTVSLGLLK